MGSAPVFSKVGLGAGLGIGHCRVQLHGKINCQRTISGPLLVLPQADLKQYNNPHKNKR